jgi:NAD(P)H-dependent FMN reductase
MKIIALGASTSSRSINRQFATFAAQQLTPEPTILRLEDYELPVFSVDLEERLGIPQPAKDFLAQLDQADLVIISFAEHNGSYAAAFKNLLDWASRSRAKTFLGTKMLLLATSPGSRGGATVLHAAIETFPHLGAHILGSFSLPSFGQNFAPGEGILHPEHRAQFHRVLDGVQELVLSSVS